MSSPESEDTQSVDQRSINEDSLPESSQFNSDTELVSDSESDIDLEEDSAHIVNEINDELQRGTYTCLVCTGEIDSSSPVWSCHICCRVYDLQCIQDWAKKGSSTDSIDSSWKCPSCNGKHFKIPNKYTCWCGKVINPPKNSHQPHSCGQTCNHKLKQCVHNCSFTCHPGPHIRQCTALGPKMLCNCGEFEQQLPCVLTPYNQGWKCPTACNDLLNCGLHHCKDQCHKGLCQECTEVLEDVDCYCGKHKKDIYCNDKVIVKSVTLDNYVGLFSCDETCDELLNCGNHKCEMTCHIKEEETYLKEKSYHKCPLSPELVDNCHCGKTTMKELNITRDSCLDPIPTCDKICDKVLPCGHRCYWNCHDGDECSPCYKLIDKKCSCNNMTFSIPCSMNQDGFVPECEQKCLALLNCRRHRCNLVCCEFQNVAMQRERDRKKELRRSAYNSAQHDNDSMTIEAVHICTKDCNKLLSCGKHTCRMTCHLGPCRPCLESSSDDLICHCGKTKLEAPVRCGSKLPPCLNQCQRPYFCGHDPMPHFCHEDDINCPRCTKLVTTKCKCYREVMVPNTLCYIEQANCGLKCGKVLSCQLHKCEKTCHKDGECAVKCLSKCGKLRSCGHKCTQVCHGSSPCPENISCNESVKITCDCGRLSKEIMCCNTAQINKLKCDDECSRIKRNKLLFEALKVDEEGNANGVVPSDTADYISQLSILDDLYTNYIIETFKKQTQWCTQIETILKDLILNQTSTKAYNFPSMKQPQRKFVHELSESFKIYSESQDMEPKRSVFVRVTSNSAIPKLSIQETITVLEKKRHAELMKAQHKKLIMSSRMKEEEEEEKSKVQLFNGIVIKDIFFGITLSMIQECLVPIYKNSEKKSSADPTVQYVDSSTYVFFTPEYKDKTEELEAELRTLRDIFLQELKSKNLAYSCLLCKIDETASVVYEIETVRKEETAILQSGEFESQWW